ncbi:hypothetical protein EVA_19006 [gut metagenome]|uniref:Uncharacterized protein n=1 Tax=gut metagenome TaxID=749906 RepID=J9FTJ3_9ZZZZ
MHGDRRRGLLKNNHRNKNRIRLSLSSSPIIICFSMTLKKIRMLLNLLVRHLPNGNRRLMPVS